MYISFPTRNASYMLALRWREGVGDCLADGGARGGLAVGARAHRQCGLLVRHRAQRLDQRVELRQQHVLPRLAEYQRVCTLVYALAGAGEVPVLQLRAEFGVVLDGQSVV